jgi:hypothetical protein
LSTIEKLKSRAKKEMASVKVLNLSKVDKSTNLPFLTYPQKGGTHEEESLNSIKLREKINYLIVKAKDQANDAF